VLLADGHAGRHERSGGGDGEHDCRFRDPSRTRGALFGRKAKQKADERSSVNGDAAGRSSEVDGSLDREVAWCVEDAR
jgi:hypothetical protein